MHGSKNWEMTTAPSFGQWGEHGAIKGKNGHQSKFLDLANKDMQVLCKTLTWTFCKSPLCETQLFLNNIPWFSWSMHNVIKHRLWNIYFPLGEYSLSSLSTFCLSTKKNSLVFQKKKILLSWSSNMSSISFKR